MNASNGNYCRNGYFRAQPGQGGELAEILLAAAEGLQANEACLLYLIGRSADNPDIVYVTEVWTDREAHDVSLQDEEVITAIRRARPLIAEIGGTEFQVQGGKGL